jgi:hypothetical protein
MNEYWRFGYGLERGLSMRPWTWGKALFKDAG